jgi:NADP-dependent 3-hydroxy acid dehydrogenase YdfG
VFEDKVVLIAGATGALGTAVTHAFAKTAARLALVSTSEDKLAALADDIDPPTECVFTATVDATDADEVAAMVEAVLAHYGRIDALINTVGAWRGGNLVHETDVAAWERTLDVNLRTAFLLSRAVLPSIIDTPANRQMMSGADTDAWVPPEDIAALFRFLCTEAGASINGARLPIYGEV